MIPRAGGSLFVRPESSQAGVLSGRDAIAAMYGAVFEGLFPPADTEREITVELVGGGHALVHWTAKTSAVRTIAAWRSPGHGTAHLRRRQVSGE